ncbi:MAG TPA: phytanoyl-CoA dioxygenase family protein [Thermoanaerobaculia bacterium]|nr:phytanoyl-CoA dioxygenase family protein [Thermoanaerobaculia bacterium]
MSSSFAADVAALNRPWVDSPYFPTLLKRANLAPEMETLVRDYARDGYVVVDPKLDDELIERAARDMRVISPEQLIFSDHIRLQDAWTLSENIRRIATAPAVIDVLRVLYQREPYPFQTLNFHCGSQQRTHSDTIHFGSIPYGFMAGVWIALEDIDEANGPLHYFPQSQKLPVYDLLDIGVTAFTQAQAFENYSRYEDFIEGVTAHEGLQRTELHVKRGQALIWASNLFHGGSPIRDHQRTRLSQVTHYHFSGCMYFAPLLSDPGLGRLHVRNLVDISTGKPIPQSYNGIPVTNPGEWPPRLDLPRTDTAKQMIGDARASSTVLKRASRFLFGRR